MQQQQLKINISKINVQQSQFPPNPLPQQEHNNKIIIRQQQLLPPPKPPPQVPCPPQLDPKKPFIACTSVIDLT